MPARARKPAAARVYPRQNGDVTHRDRELPPLLAAHKIFWLRGLVTLRNHNADPSSLSVTVSRTMAGGHAAGGGP